MEVVVMTNEWLEFKAYTEKQNILPQANTTSHISVGFPLKP